MREKKYHIYLTDDEQSRVIQSLINLKNNLIVQGRYTDAVDEVYHQYERKRLHNRADSRCHGKEQRRSRGSVGKK